MVPIVALAVALAIRRGRCPKLLWALVIALQAVVLTGGLAASRTGETDRRHTLMIVGSAKLDGHAREAARFNLSAGIALGLGIAAALPGPAGLSGVARLAAATASAANGALAFFVGHSGGELVYRHGAAEAYRKPEE